MIATVIVIHDRTTLDSIRGQIILRQLPSSYNSLDQVNFYSFSSRIFNKLGVRGHSEYHLLGDHSKALLCSYTFGIPSYCNSHVQLM